VGSFGSQHKKTFWWVDISCPGEGLSPIASDAARTYLHLAMTRIPFEGFSMDFPPGWRELDVESTFSDPTEGERKTFGRSGGTGVLHVSLLAVDPDNPPQSSRDHVGVLARTWGRARGLRSPMSIGSQVRRDGALAQAEYKLAGDYVSVWYLSNGEATLHASYLCPWTARDEDRAAREAMIASLAFG
jgi:hypothetical protein